jgi:hypothetical protein
MLTEVKNGFKIACPKGFVEDPLYLYRIYIKFCVVSLILYCSNSEDVISFSASSLEKKVKWLTLLNEAVLKLRQQQGNEIFNSLMMLSSLVFEVPLTELMERELQSANPQPIPSFLYQNLNS